MIPINILNNIKKKYNRNIQENDVLGVIDTSIFGNAKSGIVFTVDSVYWADLFEPVERMKYDDLKTVVLIDNKSNPDEDYIVMLTHYDLIAHKLRMSSVNVYVFKELMEQLKTTKINRIEVLEESEVITDMDEQNKQEEIEKKVILHNENISVESNEIDSPELSYMKDNMCEIGVIKKNDKVRIAKVEYFDNSCIYKIYYGRDLTDVYKQIMGCKTTRYLAQVYDVVYCNGNTHIIEERLSGENLAEYIENRGPLKDDVFEYVIKEICQALSVLHNNEPSILHRDIKPSNIMLLKDGSIKLFDFDAARRVDGNKEQDTVLLGTKGYAPPEQFGFSETGVYSDIYSLGMTMYVLLTGEMLENNVKKRNYKCNDKYKRIIEKCVELDITKRYNSVAELTVALEREYSEN